MAGNEYYTEEARTLARVFGAALLAGLFATTMSGWLVVPNYGTSDFYPSSVDSFGLWNIGGASHETVDGQTFTTIALLALLLALGVSAIAVPSTVRLNLLGAGALLLLASEIWLRIGIGGQVATVSGTTASGFTTKYDYGGGALSLAFVVTAGLSLWAFNQAQYFRRPKTRG